MAAPASTITERLWARRLPAILALVLGLGTLIAGSFVVRDLVRLPITSVRVAGDLRYVDRDVLRRNVAGELTAGFFGVDVSAIHGAALAMPWIREVSVRRVWPDSLHLAVIERTAVARWGAGGLVDPDGTLFRPDAQSYPAGLPLLAGPPGSQERLLERYRVARRAMEPVGRYVTEVTLTASEVLTVKVDNGIRFVLDPQRTQNSLQRFARAFTAALKSRMNDVKQVDLRYANGFAVRWKSSPAPAG